MMLVFATMIWWTRARSTARTPRARNRDATAQPSRVDGPRHEALIVCETGGVIRAWNHGASALRMECAEAVGQRKQITTAHPRRIDGGTGPPVESTGRWEGELSHATRDGPKRHRRGSMTASRAADGRLLILIRRPRHHRRKRAEEALRESEERLRVTLTSIGDA